LKTLLTALRHHAHTQPQHLAIDSGEDRLDYQTLVAEVDAAARHLSTAPVHRPGPGQTGPAPRPSPGRRQRVGLLLDNGAAWVIADLALLQAGMTCVPLPAFFSATQLRHVLADAALDTVLTDRPERLQSLLGRPPDGTLIIGNTSLDCFNLSTATGPQLPAGTTKITYTSGTTGEPRGVCLDAVSLQAVVTSLAVAVDIHAGDRSLSLLPLAILLENLANVYVALQSGATACLPALHALGIEGSGLHDPQRLLTAIGHCAPTALVLTPALLEVLVTATDSGWVLPDTVRFMAVGGAPLPAALRQRAEQAGFPVYEGYGLSEAASVVSLNRPGETRAGSVGRPLPHVAVHIADDGEILLRGALFLAYLNAAPAAAGKPDWLHTGDLGRLDEDGFLYVTGRRRAVQIASSGRNLAPHWLETELQRETTIAAARIDTEGKTSVEAEITPALGTTDAAISAAVARVNQRLPDYARIARWRRATVPVAPDGSPAGQEHRNLPS